DNDRALREAAQYSNKLENDIRGLEDAVAAERARVTSAENELASQQAILQHLREIGEQDRVRADASAAELASLTVRHEILQGELADSENRLVAQAEEVLASSRAESERLATLIDTVQSSHFWKLKRWLIRLRARLTGR
ncbi:MAG: hypothetical protein JOY69_00330, partial [Candidatus Eremiobacteraeota bacterium]|nr:hypothetical protein [Candidatus Eremiobacteraeota bacterium]